MIVFKAKCKGSGGQVIFSTDILYYNKRREFHIQKLICFTDYPTLKESLNNL